MEGRSIVPIQIAWTKTEDNVVPNLHDFAPPRCGTATSTADEKPERASDLPILMLKSEQGKRATASSELQGHTSPPTVVQNCLQLEVGKPGPIQGPKRTLTLEKDLEGIAKKYLPPLRIIEGLCTGLKCDPENLAPTLSRRLATVGKAEQDLLETKQQLTEARIVNDELTRAANEMKLTIASERSKSQSIIACLQQQISAQAKLSRALTKEQHGAFCARFIHARQNIRDLMQWGEQVLTEDAIGQEKLYDAIFQARACHAVNLDQNIFKTWSTPQVQTELNNVCKWAKFRGYLSTSMHNIEEAASLVIALPTTANFNSEPLEDGAQALEVKSEQFAVRHLGRKRSRTSKVPSE